MASRDSSAREGEPGGESWALSLPNPAAEAAAAALLATVTGAMVVALVRDCIVALRLGDFSSRTGCSCCCRALMTDTSEAVAAGWGLLVAQREMAERVLRNRPPVSVHSFRMYTCQWLACSEDGADSAAATMADERRVGRVQQQQATHMCAPLILSFLDSTPLRRIHSAHSPSPPAHRRHHGHSSRVDKATNGRKKMAQRTTVHVAHGRGSRNRHTCICTNIEACVVEVIGCLHTPSIDDQRFETTVISFFPFSFSVRSFESSASLIGHCCCCCCCSCISLQSTIMSAASDAIEVPTRKSTGRLFSGPPRRLRQSFARTHTSFECIRSAPVACVVHLQESVRAKVRTALGKTLPQELALRLETSQTNKWQRGDGRNTAAHGRCTRSILIAWMQTASVALTAVAAVLLNSSTAVCQSLLRRSRLARPTRLPIARSSPCSSREQIRLHVRRQSQQNERKRNEDDRMRQSICPFGC